MDRISFSYWKKNHNLIGQKSYNCIHKDYVYGDNMAVETFRFVSTKNSQLQYFQSENGDVKQAYFKLVEAICNSSKTAFDNFRNVTSEKYKVYDESEVKKFTEVQRKSTRIKDDSCRIFIQGKPYYVANNLKISEYIQNISERLPEDELDFYFMELGSNEQREVKMARRSPNCIYIRKINSSGHDESKEINIGMPTYRFFFEENKNLIFRRKKDNNTEYEVEVQAVDENGGDPRLGKQFKELLTMDGGYDKGDLIVIFKEDKLNYLAEVIRTKDPNYSVYNLMYEEANANERHSLILTESDTPENLLFDEKDYVKNFEQIIYYGVPGSGKSHKIDKEIQTLPNDQKMRVVFHPEYTNADFIGQILPIEDQGVDYRFKAGPFSRILKRAMQNPSKPYYLVIEEINRGNAAAIFGDLFQLLDRKEDGFSSYSIENIDLNAFIRSKSNIYNDKDIPSTVDVGNIHFTENTEIVLPPNLAIYATMNTSDQNVFTLDNAFQRRWQMELVENKFNMNDSIESAQAEASLEKFDTTWGLFQEKINTEISKQAIESGLSSMEDKRLGCWFIKPDKDNNSISTKLFSEKVLKYLWDDAFKFVRSEVFENQFQTLEALSTAYQNGVNVFKDKSFLSKITSENNQE